jgi:hypothetical protein
MQQKEEGCIICIIFYSDSPLARELKCRFIHALKAVRRHSGGGGGRELSRRVEAT